jgi:hypothetical protein
LLTLRSVSSSSFASSKRLELNLKVCSMTAARRNGNKSSLCLECIRLLTAA